MTQMEGTELKRVSLDTWIQLIGMLGVLGGLILLDLKCNKLKD